jgi:glycosyltransferase involved in cell wall biosynthesis
MRIALVSFEYAAIGGIGAYMRNAARMLASRGHDVEVFCAVAPQAEAQAQGVRVNAISFGENEFTREIAPVFAARHAAAAFEVVEGTEYRADGAQIFQAFPEIARVVKLHTPTFVVTQLDLVGLTLSRKARFIAGSLRRGRWPRPYWTYRPGNDPEHIHALSADEITAPSQAMLDRVAAEWSLPADRTAVIPNVFSPSPALLEIDPATRTDQVLFLGRLEVRKGVVALARAIPLVLNSFPKARFRVVGRALPDPTTGEDLEALMRRLIGDHADAVEFVGAAPYAEIPGHFARSDICVFPSLWEASGYVCQEAMAAARGVVGSSSGGMAEILDAGRYGDLVPPDAPRKLADAILGLLADPERRIALGVAARARVLEAYGPDAVGPLQEASYQRAIARARRRNGQP